uniref:Uncharacterized protein n=1 Tax=Anopheles atroparvus TaxID=41427 RepID=A0AAG5CRC9_ANOAO
MLCEWCLLNYHDMIQRTDSVTGTAEEKRISAQLGKSAETPASFIAGEKITSVNGARTAAVVKEMLKVNHCSTLRDELKEAKASESTSGRLDAIGKDGMKHKSDNLGKLGKLLSVACE